MSRVRKKRRLHSAEPAISTNSHLCGFVTCHSLITVGKIHLAQKLMISFLCDQLPARLRTLVGLEFSVPQFFPQYLLRSLFLLCGNLVLEMDDGYQQQEKLYTAVVPTCSVPE